MSHGAPAHSSQRGYFELRNQNRYAQLVDAPESVDPPPSSSQDTSPRQETADASQVEVRNQSQSTTNQLLLPAQVSNSELPQVVACLGETLDLCSTPTPSPSRASSSSSEKYHSDLGEQTCQKKSQQFDCKSDKVGASNATTTSASQSLEAKQVGSSSLASPAASKTILAQSNDTLPRDNQARKSSVESSTSSQMTTSFVTTQSSGSSGRGTNLTRTISQSMLDLDKSVRMDSFEVSWKHLNFNYESNWFKRKIGAPPRVLNDISGGFKSNQLIAIIGPSGCGKTTLLQLLGGNEARQKERLQISGLDEPKVAFIGQNDCLLPGLTAKETLIYASKLQNSKPDFDHETHVQSILTELGLLECADRNVAKLSGGQMKRVTIAQELLYPTNLLILDEVTSGLDTSTSYAIVKLLKQLVSDQDYPMSIIMSIHQPSAKLFAIFDQVYVMSEGTCLYDGSTNVECINAHLSSFNLECPRFHNVADFLIEIACDDLNTDKTSIKEELAQFQRNKASSMDAHNQPLSDLNQMMITEKEEKFQLTVADDARNGVPMIMTNNLYDAIDKSRRKREKPFARHLLIHLSRSFLRIRRSYILTYLQLITYIILGLQLSTFYGPDIGRLSGCPQLPKSLTSFIFSDDSDHEAINFEMRRIQENMNFLLVAIMTSTFASLEITVLTFPLEAKTIKREWRNGWYRVTSYFLGRTMADLPFQMVYTLIFCTIIYGVTSQIGFGTWRFASFVAIITISGLIAQTVGFIFGALFMNNLPAAVFMAPLAIFPSLLFSGFFSRVSVVPAIYKPLTYLSNYRYSFDALIVTLYGYDRCHCDQDVLTSYHANLHNQTSGLRDLMNGMFGSNDCAGNQENSIEDTTTTTPSSLLTSTLASTLSHNLTSTPGIRALEDALVDSVFEKMSNSSAPTEDVSQGGIMGLMSDRFGSKLITMVNTQSNFGHSVPQQCDGFNSYLITEFGLENQDLMIGMLVLVAYLLALRMICLIILNFTIATRAS